MRNIIRKLNFYLLVRAFLAFGCFLSLFRECGNFFGSFFRCSRLNRSIFDICRFFRCGFESFLFHLRDTAPLFKVVVHSDRLYIRRFVELYVVNPALFVDVYHLSVTEYGMVDFTSNIQTVRFFLFRVCCGGIVFQLLRYLSDALVVFLAYLVDKSRRSFFVPSARRFSHVSFGFREIQPFHSTRESHKAQTTLFFHAGFLALFHCSAGREYALGHAADEAHGKLQSL